jgi:DNA gyrase/topoisomerase IV subunit A
MSDEKKKALEALHLTREAKQIEQRKLQKLRITIEKENILAEEKILKDTIKRLEQEENNHERHLKKIYIIKN